MHTTQTSTSAAREAGQSMTASIRRLPGGKYSAELRPDGAAGGDCRIFRDLLDAVQFCREGGVEAGDAFYHDFSTGDWQSWVPAPPRMRAAELVAHVHAITPQPGYTPAPAPAHGAADGKRYLWDVIDALGCYAEPYNGGVRVFIGRADIAQPALYRELWDLADARVVGTLSGPSLYIRAL